MPDDPTPDPTAEQDWRSIAGQAVEALRLTREYLGPAALPAWPGWSWFDATNTYLEAAGLPLLEQEPVPQPSAGGDPAPSYSPDYTVSDRGFKHLEPVPGTYAGRVRVYESSAAAWPHLWLAITEPKPNDPDGPVKEAHAHLTADAAEEVALHLLWLLEHHYQGASGSARATAAIRALLAGGDSATPADDAELVRLLANFPSPLFPTPPPAGATQQIRATHPYGFRAGRWADLIGTTRADIGGQLGRDLYVVRFPDDGYIDLWPATDPSDAYEFRPALQPDAATTRFAGDLTQLALSEIARHLEQGDTLTAGGDWAPAAAMPPRHQVRRWLIARGVRRGRAQVAMYLRILMALNSAEVAGYTGGRQDRPTRHSSGPAAEAAAE